MRTLFKKNDVSNYCRLVRVWFDWSWSLLFRSLIWLIFSTLLQTPDQNNSEQDWQGSNPATPGTSRQMLLSEIGPGGLLRADTLEINPGFINPHDIDTNSHQPNDVTWVSYAANEQVKYFVFLLMFNKAFWYFPRKLTLSLFSFLWSYYWPRIIITDTKAA